MAVFRTCLEQCKGMAKYLWHCEPEAKRLFRWALAVSPKPNRLAACAQLLDTVIAPIRNIEMRLEIQC